ncbi:hypothetical protein M011DRAFT_505332 [Sporormia fimetaria CBS 119925]|uniref:Uncharacterized protein n=1 Tax=Sporormia fimetaria CBS 119925 TaxID=1340428 RepID=A0A6A6V6N7_9PLEO|nr:hypothetical protein M011DRAFT_505332 [Sporormia fimetaria CBS 119925]
MVPYGGNQEHNMSKLYRSEARIAWNNNPDGACLAFKPTSSMMASPEFGVFAKAVEAGQLVLSSNADKEADKPYLKNGASLTLESNDDLIKVTHAVLSAVSILSFLGGATGIVFASGVALFQGIMPTGKGQNNAIDALTNAFEESKIKDILQTQMAKLRSLSNWISLRTETWARPDADLEHFRADDIAMLQKEVSGATDSLATEVMHLEKAIMSWEKPETRVAVLLSYTLLFVCYNAFSGKIDKTAYLGGIFWPKVLDPFTKDGRKKDAEKAMATYVEGFEKHVARVRKNDDVILNSWSGLVEQCEGLMKPPTPLIPPAVSDTPMKVDKLHPALTDTTIKYVAYAYSLGTIEDGWSNVSPWTDWVPLTREAELKLPVITLKDGGYFLPTKRRVYRDTLKEDKGEG